MRPKPGGGGFPTPGSRATRGDADAKIKPQPEGLSGVFDVVKNKKSNVEMRIGATFPYDACEAIARPDALGHVAAWRACRPLLEKLGAV